MALGKAYSRLCSDGLSGRWVGGEALQKLGLLGGLVVRAADSTMCEHQSLSSLLSQPERLSVMSPNFGDGAMAAVGYDGGSDVGNLVGE